jgi:hypothetical protein
MKYLKKINTIKNTNEVVLPNTGEILYFTNNEISYLIYSNVIYFDININEFISTINKNDFNKILIKYYKKLINKKIQIGFNNYGIIKDVFIYNKNRLYVNGKKINNYDYSLEYKKNDIVFLVRIKTKYTVYKKEQILNKIINNKLLEINNYHLNNEILGDPSGQLIEVSEAEIDYLRQLKMIKWSGSKKGLTNYIGYYFNDKDYYEIMEILYSLYE